MLMETVTNNINYKVHLKRNGSTSSVKVSAALRRSHFRPSEQKSLS